MYELRSLWQSTLRPVAVFALLLLVAIAAVSPVAAQTSSTDPAGTASSGSDTGAETTGDGDEEDIEEWESDILKSTASPSPSNLLEDLLASVLRAFGLRGSGASGTVLE